MRIRDSQQRTEQYFIHEIRTKGSTAMLVLTRKRSEMIQIGDNIVIKVIQTGRSTVKIGIEAPSQVRVLRSELCDTPEQEKGSESTRVAQLVERLRQHADCLAVAGTETAPVAAEVATLP